MNRSPLLLIFPSSLSYIVFLSLSGCIYGCFFYLYVMSIIDKIKQAFNWIRDLFARIPSELKENAEIALRITNIVKQAIDSPVVVITVQLTKTPIDDAIRAQVSNCLHAISAWLGGSTIDDIPHIIKGMSSKHRNAVLSKMASDITACLDGNEQKESLYDAVVQNVYTHGKLQDSDTANA